jgi:hypothetical protein
VFGVAALTRPLRPIVTIICMDRGRPDLKVALHIGSGGWASEQVWAGTGSF